MKLFVRFLFAALLVFGALSLGIAAGAQTSNTGIVLGTVTDKANAVVPDATVELTNTATNETKTTTTGASGDYVFPNVPPGTYNLKISKAGFATTTFANIKVDVTKSYSYNATLEVSSGKEVIEVTAQSQAELQTVDAVVGNVVGESELMRLPTLGRDSRELLTLQPMSTPFESSNGGGFGNSGGTIAGAAQRSERFQPGRHRHHGQRHRRWRHPGSGDSRSASKMFRSSESASPITTLRSAVPRAVRSTLSARAVRTTIMAQSTGTTRTPPSMPTLGITATRPMARAWPTRPNTAA